MKFVPVPVEKLDEMWGEISVELQKPIEITPNKVDLDSVLNDAKNGAYLIWVVLCDEEVVAVVSTRIINYPKGKSLAMDFIGGTRMKEWLPLAMQSVEDHARHNNCNFLEGFGRRAWLKWLEKYDWKQAYITFQKEL